VRSKVEHPFLTIKRLWGFAKVRYRGLAKNANRAFAMLAMLNIRLWRKAADGRGAFGMSAMRGISSLPAPRTVSYPMKTPFAFRFRINLNSPSRFAVTCSAFH
jgi:hypothetical protein